MEDSNSLRLLIHHSTMRFATRLPQWWLSTWVEMGYPQSSAGVIHTYPQSYPQLWITPADQLTPCLPGSGRRRQKLSTMGRVIHIHAVDRGELSTLPDVCHLTIGLKTGDFSPSIPPGYPHRGDNYVDNSVRRGLSPTKLSTSVDGKLSTMPSTDGGRPTTDTVSAYEQNRFQIVDHLTVQIIEETQSSCETDASSI